MLQINSADAVRLLKAGKVEGFNVIFNLYHKQLYVQAKKYLKDSHLAEDALQDVFIKLWLKRDTLDNEKSVQSYLAVCLKNHILNMIRNQKRRILGAYELKEEYHPLTNCTEDDMQLKEYRKILNNGIEAMPEKRREIFRLKFKYGLSNEQIAKKLKISNNTVKAHFFQGNKQMKSYLKREAELGFNL
ncbi:MAG: RNA polymerase sigma-70 factor [Balneolaceae bacterium]|nr:MAG: RNA polymerase sigma-70 factor [Balneolaceae bacterium]